MPSKPSDRPEMDWDFTAAFGPGPEMPYEPEPDHGWGQWTEPTAMEKLREQRSGPHAGIECHNCHTKGGMIFDPLNEWARCNNCGARTPISGDMPIDQKLDHGDFMHFYEDEETGEPMPRERAFVPANPDVAWPGLNNLGPRRQGGMWDGLNRMVNGPAYQPPAENMQGLSQHCYFHPDRPAVSHEGFAAMCQECAESYARAKQHVQP